MAENVTVEPKIFQVTVVKEDPKISITTPGTQGPQGEKGDKGDKGDTGNNGGNFTYEEQVGSTTWNITHNLGYRPAVQVVDYGNNNIEGEVEHTNANSLVIRFSEAISGYAYLS